MEWKKELIQNEFQAEIFIRRYIRAPESTSPFHFTILNADEEFKVEAFSRKEDAGQNKPIFQLYLKARLGQLRFEGIKSQIRRQSFGNIGLKAALGVAAGLDCSYIILEEVQNTGMCLWPHRGSLPLHGGLLPGDFEPALREEMSPQAREQIQILIGIAEKSPLWAWRLMSQSGLQLRNGQLARHIIFDNMPLDRNHVLLPGEPTTRMILRDHLGEIPAFRPYQGQFANVVAELETRPTEAARLTL